MKVPVVLMVGSLLASRNLRDTRIFPGVTVVPGESPQGTPTVNGSKKCYYIHTNIYNCGAEAAISVSVKFYVVPMKTTKFDWAQRRLLTLTTVDVPATPLPADLSHTLPYFLHLERGQAEAAHADFTKENPGTLVPYKLPFYPEFPGSPFSVVVTAEHQLDPLSTPLPFPVAFDTSDERALSGVEFGRHVGYMFVASQGAIMNLDFAPTRAE